MRTGYAVLSGCVSAYVVFLLGMGGLQWTQTVPDRVFLTLLGGALAMISYAVYPAWETPRLRTRLADWLAANGRYASAVVAHYADPEPRLRRDPPGAARHPGGPHRLAGGARQGHPRAGAPPGPFAFRGRRSSPRARPVGAYGHADGGASAGPGRGAGAGRREARRGAAARPPSRARRRCASGGCRAGRRSSRPWPRGTARACPTGWCAAGAGLVLHCLDDLTDALSPCPTPLTVQ